MGGNTPLATGPNHPGSPTAPPFGGAATLDVYVNFKLYALR